MAEQENEQENEPIKSNLDFTVKLYRICCLLPSENRVKPTEGLEDANHPIVTHLTEREIYNFEKIWKLVQKSLPDIGKKTFVRLFSDHPNASKSFDKFRGLEGQQLLESVVLDVHGMVVMNTIDEIVSHLDEGPDLIRDILKELGQSHAKFGSQMLAEDFWHIEQALIEAINEKLGGLKQNALALLKKTVRFLISGIVEGYEEEVRQTVAVGKERVESDMHQSSHSISHKKPDLSEMIEKDMEEKIHQNEVLHKSHHHRHHHHGHHHHHHHQHHKHGSIHKSITGSIVMEDWMIASQPHASGLLSVSTMHTRGSHSSSASTTWLSASKQLKPENEIHCVEDVEHSQEINS